MRTLQINKFKGFTVIELMIVVVIVAILLALAYPSYIKYVRKANRGDAQQLLMNWSINQEIWRSNHTQYATGLELPPPSTTDKYEFAVDLFPNPALGYTLTATALGDQANDASRGGILCEVLNLRSDGRKFSNDDDTELVCWD